MIAARHFSMCPSCDWPIEPGDNIGKIGLAYFCAACVRDWEQENASAPEPVVTYPLSGVYEAGH